MLSRGSAHAAVLAVVVFAFALVVSGSGIEGYSHLQHPVAWLGADPLPDATGFNLLAFVLPGLLVAWVALRLRAAFRGSAGNEPAIGWTARIGAQLVLLSALAFALQGVLPLDATDLDGARSSRHAAAWTMWWIAFAAGGALLAAGLRGNAAWRTTAAFSLLAAILVPACALALPQLLPPGLAQRLAFASWFAWTLYVGGVVGRRGQP